MRNRGVEVYIVGENEGGAYDRVDLLALLNGIGLSGNQTTRTLLELHEDIKHSMPGSDVSSLPSILLAASVTVQLLERGRDVNSALKEACADVFVQGQLSKVNKQKVQEMVDKHLNGLVTNCKQLVPDDTEAEDDVSLEGIFHPCTLPSVDELSRNALWATIRRDAALLVCLLNGAKQCVEPQCFVPLLPLVTRLLMEQATPADWQLRGDWLKKVWTELLPEDRATSELIKGDRAEFVQCMPEIVAEALQVVFHHPLQEKLSKMLDKLKLSEGDKILQHYPLDLNLAPQLLAHLAKLSQDRAPDRMAIDDDMNGEETDVDSSVLDEVTTIARRLYLLFRTTATSHVEYSKLRQAVDVRHTANTAIQLSYALHQGLMGIDDLPHPLLAHLYPFFKSLDAFVTDAISTEKCSISEDTVYEVLLALKWRDRCWQVCDRPIKGLDSFHLGQFAQHWGWLSKKLLSVVPCLLLNSDSVLPQALQMVSQRISDHLAALPMTLPASEHQRALQRRLGRPPPYKTGSSAQTAQQLQRLSQAMDVVGSIARVDAGRLGNRKRRRLARGVTFAVRDGGFACRKLMELLSAVAQLNSQAATCVDDDLLDAIQGLEASLASHGLYHQDGGQHVPMDADGDGNQSEDGRAKAHVAIHVGLWPLREQVALYREQVVGCNFLARKIRGEECTVSAFLEQLRSLLDYTVSHTPASPPCVLPYASLLQSGLDHTPSGSEVTMAFMSRLWRNAATCQVPLWLSWRQYLADAGNISEGEIVSLEGMQHGPANLHMPLRTHCVTHLLYPLSQRPRPSAKGDREVKRVTGSRVSTDVPLGQYLEKVDQLRALAELLWSNASTMSSNRLCFKSSSVNYLLLSLGQLLQTLESLIRPPDLDSWHAALEEVASMATAGLIDKSSLASAVQDLQQVLSQNTLDSLSEGTPEDVAGQMPMVGPAVKACLDCLSDLSSFAELGDESMDIGIPDWASGEESQAGSGDGDHLVQLMVLGKGWVHLGLLEVHLLAPRGPVDPAQKAALKLQYIRDEMTDITNELKVRSLSSQLLTGRKLEDMPLSLLPERVRLAQRRLALLEDRAPELAKQTAFRPEPPEFDAMLQDVTHYLTSIGSRSTVEGLLHKLTSAFDSLSTGKAGDAQACSVQKVLNEEKAWQKSQRQFLHRIQEGYPLYPDQWVGLVATVMQMQYGMRLAGHALLSLVERGTFSVDCGSVEAGLCSLAQFPVPLIAENQLASSDVLQLVKNLSAYSAVESEQSGYNKTKMSLLQLSLVRARHQALLAGFLEPKTLQGILSILDHIVVAWRQAEDAARRREAEEASLYKYKTKTHGDGLTDEEREDRDFRQSFPSFEKDFADLTKEPTLESQPDSDEPASGEESDAVAVPIHDTQMRQVCAVHRELFTKLVRAGWIRSCRPTLNASDALYHQALKDGYAVMVRLGGRALPFLDPSLDNKLLGAHLLMVRYLHSALSPADRAGTEEHPQPYDIYHDGNIEEAIQCRPLLERFCGRILELLEQWPEHPTLKQLTLLIDRILEFPVTSPLMKFVTGLELLLEKAQEWEGNASRAVSVREHLEQITDLVIQWRKLELRCWSACLDTVAYRMEQGANKWWFHIYQLLQSHLGLDITKATDDQDCHPSGGETSAAMGSEGDDGKSQTTESLVAALEQFLEGSNLGEFAGRLQMLLSFHCQVAMQPRSQKQMELVSILWNLYCYYKQFLAAVEAEIKTRRAPIEKELKGFVKIARWNDINFWAVKQAVEKSHKTLHKFSKKFEAELKEPARGTFIDTKVAEKEEIFTDGNAGTRLSDFDEFLTPDEYKSYIEIIPPAATSLITDKSLHARLSSLLPRMTKLCLTVFKKCPYPALTVAVDEFTGEIVSGVKELQSLDVSKEADKEKQKTQVHRIQQRKRKALADLFRYLTTIGLSYKKGLTLARPANQNKAMLLPPVDLTVALETEDAMMSFGHSETVSFWAGCQHHFVKSIARRAALEAALAAPSKELGIGNIERCKGFTEHLSLLATTQRQDIVGLAEGLVQMRSVLNQLRQLKVPADHRGNDPVLPHQESTAAWVATSKELVDLSRETARQYLLLLDCCPQKLEGAPAATPLPREWLAAMDTARKGDELWVATRDKLQECQSILEMANQTVEPRASQLVQDHDISLLFWSDLQLIDDTFEKLEMVSDAFADLEQLFTLPRGGERSYLATMLTETRQRLLQTALQYARWKRWLVCVGEGGEEEPGDEDEMETAEKDFANRTESVLASVLLAVQGIVKSHRRTQAGSQPPLEETLSAERETTEEEEEDFDLQEGHLVKHLSTALGQDAVTLDVGRVSKVMGSLLLDLREMRDDCHSTRGIWEFNACTALTLRLVPVLHQYLGLVAFTLNQTVACHRTTCKLLSVLLGIFSELAAKGFCLPAEYSDEVGGEGATQFQDIEGGGIGEGEGMKDVSDQIENEEQVQDTKKPGEKQDEQDFSNQPDVKDEEQGIEMSEDFQGKLHDAEAKDVENSDEDDGDDEHEMDKQMGEVDQPGADTLDERMWGDKEDDEDEEGKDGKKKEEFGEGKGEEKQTDLVAKDDNKGAADDKGDNEKQGKEGEDEMGENNENQKPNNLEPQDEGEFNDDEVDPRKANEPPEAPVPEDLDIPNDLNLDGGKMDDENEEGATENQDEANPFDIETKLPDQKDSGMDQDAVDEKEDGEEREEGNQDEGDQPSEPRMEEGGEGAEDESGGEEDAGRDDREDGDGEDADEADGDQKGGVGLEPQEDDDEPIPEDSSADYQPDRAHLPQAMPEPAENYGRSQEKTETVQEQVAQEEAGKSEEEKNRGKENVGSAESSLKEGHEGAVPSQTLPRQNQSEQRQSYKRRPGHSDAERSLGSVEEKAYKRLRTMDAPEKKTEGAEEENQSSEPSDQDQTWDLYEHIKDASSHYDTQMMDVASEDQLMQEQATPNQEEEDTAAMETDEEIKPLDDEKEEKDNPERMDKLPGTKIKSGERQTADDETSEPNSDVPEGDVADDGTATRVRDPMDTGEIHASTIHTTLDLISQDAAQLHVMTTDEYEALRQEMEQKLSLLSQKQGTADEEREAQETWHRYESLTSGLARDLCEQLRLVLEPTRASKLRGDFRTGKRINMRKVIPYIASGFRKDKIWLRRTKPSKRQYQILLAVDDSSSMADNRSKQLAFESLAVISNALTWLEAGELAVCSFGESVQLLHPFHEQFTDQSGAKILRQFTFSQNKTKVAQLLTSATASMIAARSRLQMGSSHLETSQLLLIVSDGRGLFLEGVEAVKAAVRRARDANIFLVFVALDNPENKDSILDIKVPIFGGPGQLPQINSYMEHFPFPFYIILKDINAMPEVLSDALRQWFELVTAGDIHY
ncbi:midasin-like isoform X2 [Acanthaster planci]|uniref:Midasin-like isoform X2 n=1 Tax=Acanthaster planci TaxID=133434 RepID=A0A8B7ZMJ5_ACAPL|nr:midasin-like isoform X2 [Acanthaster planci]